MNRPETAIVLAEDDVARGSPASALVRLLPLTQREGSGNEWIADHASRSWSRHSHSAREDVQQAVWSGQRPIAREPALATLALMALEQGLARPFRRALEVAPGDRDAAILLACDDLHRGDIVRALPHVPSRIPGLRDDRIQPKIWSLLRNGAVASPIGRGRWFFQTDARPQILELLEAPLSWTYGARIACWTLQGQPQPYAITGQGPASVRSAVSAIVNDLAIERNCASDVILAGAVFFDLAAKVAPRQHNTWTLDALWPRMRALAQPLGASAALEQANASPPIRSQLQRRMRRIFDAVDEVAPEALARVAQEAGSVERVEVTPEAYHQVVATARAGAGPAGFASLPVLMPYRSNDQPITVPIPLRWVGTEDYQRVAKAYRRGVLAGVKQE